MTHHPFAPNMPSEPAVPTTIETERRYDPPAVVYEAKLEVRAGTPVGLPDAANPLNLP
jgi:hypothetical protein